MNLDIIIDQHHDPYLRAAALKEAQDHWVTEGGTVKTAQQAINDTLGMRAVEAAEDNDEPQRTSLLTTLYTLNQWAVNKTVARYGNDEDIKAAALLGLWQACERFQPGRGSFYLYAQNHIRFEAAKAAAEGRYDSFYEFRNTPAVRTAIEDIEREGGTVTSDEISSRTGLSIAVINRIINPLNPASIDTTVHDEDGKETVADRIPNQTYTQPLDAVMTAETRDAIVKAVLALPVEQRIIIARHYGLDGEPPQPLTEIVADNGWRKQDGTEWHKAAKEALASLLNPDLLLTNE